MIIRNNRIRKRIICWFTITALAH